MIIPEALPLAKLQRTSMVEKEIIKSYKQDFEDIFKQDGLVQSKDFNILDIGCGIAGWECLLNESPKIYLIDKTQVEDKIWYGYEKEGAFYNSLEIARKNLVANGIDGQNIYTHEANNTIPFKVQFDLVVSFISCGFHYPVETYLDEIYSKLKKGGTLIIDLRKGTDGLRNVTNKFGNHKVIRDESTYLRVVAVK